VKNKENKNVKNIIFVSFLKRKANYILSGFPDKI